MKATNVIGSTATVREKCIDRIMPYTFFPTIFLQVPMCYEEFLIQPVRQFDKSINHTFSLQSINKSIRHRVKHHLEHAPIIVIFEFFVCVFVFVFCFVRFGWLGCFVFCCFVLFFCLFVLIICWIFYNVTVFFFCFCLFLFFFVRSSPFKPKKYYRALCEPEFSFDVLASSCYNRWPGILRTWV